MSGKTLLENFILKKNILIFQMGKVASVSIEQELTKYNLGVFHFHTLFHTATFQHIKHAKLPLQSFLFYKIRKLLILFFARLPYKKIKIITLFREPISRNISMLFQQSVSILFSYFANQDSLEPALESNSYDLFRNVYFKEFNDKIGLNWFEKEFMELTGINVLDYQFDQELGYQVISNKRFDVLILKYERLSELSSVIGDFVGIENLQIRESNRGSNKWYSDMYWDFRNRIKFDQGYLDEFYKSEIMNHFYSRDEIDLFYKQWIMPPQNDTEPTETQI